MSILNEVGKRIKTLRLQLDMTQEELAQKAGYTSRSSINKIEIGLVDLPQTKVMMIADALGVTPTYLLFGEESTYEKGVDLPHPDLRPITKRRFPMLGEIACGKPIFASEDHESYIDASASIDADFCLTAKGDSMKDARIKDGDVVFIKQMPIVQNGEIAAVVIDGEATLKKWFYYPDKQKLVLNPANQNYEPLVYTGAELDTITCLGKAVFFLSNL